VELVQVVVARKDGKALVAAQVCIEYHCSVNLSYVPGKYNQQQAPPTLKKITQFITNEYGLLSQISVHEPFFTIQHIFNYLQINYYIGLLILID